MSVSTIEIVYTVVSALLIGWLGWVSRTLDQHGRALAVLVSQVTPTGASSLQTVMADHSTQLALLTQRLTEVERSLSLNQQLADRLAHSEGQHQ